jgi:hypothetical protein
MRPRFDVALGAVGLAPAAVALGLAVWGLATGEAEAEEVSADRWFLVGVVMAGIINMVITTVRYGLRYSPSPQDGLIVIGWVLAALEVLLSLFAWGDDPHMSFSAHLSAAAGAAALTGWLAFGLGGVAILLAQPRKHSSGEVEDGASSLINH